MRGRQWRRRTAAGAGPAGRARAHRCVAGMAGAWRPWRIGGMRRLHGGRPVTRWLLVATRVALGALFLWAAATKLPDMKGFAQDVANYRIVPALLVPHVAAAGGGGGA